MSQTCTDIPALNNQGFLGSSLISLVEYQASSIGLFELEMFQAIKVQRLEAHRMDSGTCELIATVPPLSIDSIHHC